MLPDLLTYVDRGTIFVEPPTDLIFLCGGKTNPKHNRFASIRDAFLKIPDNPALHGRDVLLAESVNIFHLSRPAYPDLLSFEIDFAQICELILLFSESYGSIAELGSFCMEEELAKKLLVVARDFHLRGDSFIKLGPLQRLKQEHGIRALFVINDDETGLRGESIKNIRLDILKDRLTPAINDRFKAVAERTTFDRSRHGHLTKLMVGFLQEYGALTACELVGLLNELEVAIDGAGVDRLMLCAEAAKWVSREQRGFDTFYFAMPDLRDALILRFDRGSPVFNRERRRQTFREFWRKSDPQRWAGIKKFAGGVR